MNRDIIRRDRSSKTKVISQNLWKRYSLKSRVVLTGQVRMTLKLKGPGTGLESLTSTLLNHSQERIHLSEYQMPAKVKIAPSYPLPHMRWVPWAVPNQNTFQFAKFHWASSNPSKAIVAPASTSLPLSPSASYRSELFASSLTISAAAASPTCQRAALASKVTNTILRNMDRN